MDWRQFFASVIGSVAWPLAVVVIVLLFRKELRRLLSLVRKFGAGGLSVELSDQVEAVRGAAEAVEAESATSDVVPLDPAMLALVKSFPAAAVLQTFKELEGVLLKIRARLPDDKPHRNLNEVLNVLLDQNYISSSVIALFQRLRETRNIVAHSRDEEEMTSGEAIELVREIKRLQNLLNGVLDQLPRKSIRI